MSYQLSRNIEENIRHFHNKLSVNRNFDIVYRTMSIGGRQSCLYMMDGFANDSILEKILEFLLKLKPEEIPKEPHEFSKQFLPYGEIILAKDEESVVTFLLMGMTCLFVDGYQDALIVDCREYPGRSVEEPEKDRVLRGSRDGFVETLVFNTALIRRRIRDPKLIHEMVQVGEASKTDIALCYMDDRVNPEVLSEIKKRLANLKVDALTMNQESLAECIYPHKWYNPFPKFKYTERPDTATACILEGNLVILVDNSPAAMVVPSSIFDIIEEANDYYFPPITGTYLRLTRVMTFFVALFLTPVFLLLMQNPNWVPDWLQFILVKDEIYVPLILQLLILEFAIDGLKLASVNTPSMLTTPLSIIAALIVGDFSVSSGWFSSETMLYQAFVVLANYTQPNMELSYALKFMRLILLVLTALLNLPGFIIGMILCFAAILGNKTITGHDYLYPLIPFDGQKLLQRFFRVRLSYEVKEKK
jgi:stage V sporulation protein AF